MDIYNGSIQTTDSMKKKSKFGFNTGNTLMPSYHSPRRRRFSKDQLTVVKFLDTFGGHRSTEELRNLRNRIVEMVDCLVEDGGIKVNLNSRARSHRYLRQFRLEEPTEVAYSLNKRKRWLLPEKILHAVEELRRGKIAEQLCGGEQESGPDIDFEMSYLEREIQFDYGRALTNIGIYSGANHRRHDSVFYASSSASHRCKTQAKSVLSNESDLRESAMEKEHVDHKEVARSRRRRGHNQHFRDVQRKEPKRRPVHENDASAGAHAVPQIHYEVCYPHDSSYMFCYHYKCDYQFRDAKNSKRRRKYHGGLKWDVSDFQDITELIDYDCIDPIRDCKFEESLVSDQDVLRVKSTTYADILQLSPPKGLTKQKKFKMTKSDNIAGCKMNTASSEHVKMHGKNKVVYIDECFEKNENNIARHDGSTDIARALVKHQSLDQTTPSLCTKVKTNSVLQTTLRSQFGDAYMEGFAIPRRFLINVSHHISNSYNDWEKHEEIGDDLWMAFTLFGENKFENRDECELKSPTCDIRITFHGRWGSIKMSEIHTVLSTFATSSASSVSLIDLVDHTISFLFDKSSNTTTEINHILVGNSETLKYHHFSEMNKWTTRLYSSTAACKLVSQLPLLKSSRNTKRLTSVRDCCCITDTNDSVGIMCDICLSESSFSELQATALSSCKHWFCNDCWENHLTEGITNGTVSLECPSYECYELIDHATLFSLVGHDLYQKHWYHLQKMKIDQRPNWKWCPQNDCDMVVQVPTEKKPASLACVQCECSLVWCFDCQQEPHWPISCDMTEKYLKMTAERQDKECVFYVKIKRCPSCEYPLTKGAGCQHILCRCGFSFCWVCLRPWADHGSFLACSKHEVELTNFELQQASSVRVREEYFVKAMEYRKRKKQLNHQFCKMQATSQLTHHIVKTMKGGGGGTPRNRLLPATDHPLFYKNIEHVTKQACLLYEVTHFLEFMNVYASQTTNRKIRRLLGRISLLLLLEEKLTQLVLVPNQQPLEEWITSLNKTVEDLKKELMRVSRIITRSHQKVLHK